jgi:hypothetical protein
MGHAAQLATEDVPWKQMHAIQVHERIAPSGDPKRNLASPANCKQVQMKSNHVEVKLWERHNLLEQI